MHKLLYINFTTAWTWISYPQGDQHSLISKPMLHKLAHQMMVMVEFFQERQQIKSEFRFKISTPAFTLKTISVLSEAVDNQDSLKTTNSH